ncbi:hypothetical protein M409DRAFT_53416 [Zasmidium cellare ATCC 36951]|uniref:Pentatricopeptide repeat-containing protein-mitochondrial domain-containing protein n=1 Tax=Zasmidium cellare ATCC 36951 TaxID=1080233 RepID=A0A6A6CPE4_ZASCE|nr:uncharacterized protein M409DRAFT_53416 [Zasmidium cellare ATCC 36951]KAF2168098.1 hypothetical protein M409DRAFT_53416 [Zasmidium cellare ATCC 36951]
MQSSKAAIDPLWQCLCPSWSPATLARASRFLTRPTVTTRPCLQIRKPLSRNRYYNRPTTQAPINAADKHDVAKYIPPARSKKRQLNELANTTIEEPTIHFDQETVPFLYGRLHTSAVYGQTKLCRSIAEYLVKERKEKPSAQLYNALILSNTHNTFGAAWRAAEYLEEMQAEGLMPDVSTCHAVLKVLSIHVDHLLRTDILNYMQQRWFQLSDEGAHDVAVGLLREGLFEQALQRLDEMRGTMNVDSWLWDMAVYMLCDAGEIDEAYRIMRTRYDSNEQTVSRTLWSYFLDKASDCRHYDATTLVWSSHVNQGYLNPSSGVCLNVLATAARVGDAVLATEVFAHLSKRGTAFQPIHYELLIQTYLSTDPPDLERAISILTIMPMEKLEPTVTETRPLFLYLRDKPELAKSALATLRSLHEQDRKMPIAVLNLLIECHVEQRNLAEAMKLYKLIHTFAPISQGAQKSFANIDTFNLLLKGCRVANPPDDQQASFLVSELLALRIVPTSLTYDRLILVFTEAAKHAAPGLDPSIRHIGNARGGTGQSSR